MPLRGAAEGILSARRSFSPPNGHARNRRPDRGNKRATIECRPGACVALLVEFQDRLAVTLFATLAFGLGTAALSTRKILKSEAHAHARFYEVAEAHTQLTNLSAKLVSAQEIERRALSRELHDEVGQALSAVLVELRNLSVRPAVRIEEQTRNQLELIKGLVENTVRVVRNMSLLLRPSQSCGGHPLCRPKGPDFLQGV
jgi:signal transduction histidine kinase